MNKTFFFLEEREERRERQGFELEKLSVGLRLAIIIVVIIIMIVTGKGYMGAARHVVVATTI